MSHEHHHGPTDANPDHPRTAAEWDERYNTAERLWTSEVNPALAREAADLPPGRALDVGCGEGADSRWLADHGWTVMAIDISQVAIDRAAATDSRETIDWRQMDLTADAIPSTDSGSALHGFDLVTVHYFGIDIDRTDIAAKLVDAVAPGGTLLVVSHDATGMREHGVDPDVYFQPADIAERFADQLDVQILGTVPRGRAAGGTTEQRHMDDAVLKARKR